MIVPTILIGLGGIGSTVVTRVYRQIPRELRNLVPVHIFDTNINDLQGLKKILGEQRVTQTSRAIRVGQYLQAKDPDSPIFQWFPSDNQLVLRKTLTEGAGQMRVVSRLAYLDAMERGKMQTLEKQIAVMFTDNREIAAVRVFIACSLGGGTGAGMFLQTALYLQDILKKHGKDFIIRGAFLLPDAYLKKLPDNQWNDVRANAYACIKELDAITRNVNTQLLGRAGPTINFEYRPDQLDCSYQDLVITQEHLPYNYCFLFDELNQSGKPLPDLENYQEQMVTAIFLQLFSPLSQQQFSVEDNFIRSYIRNSGSNYFCGAGTSRLFYPYPEIVDYLAQRQAAAILKGEWCHLDASFNDELRQYQADLAGGINRPEPDRGRRYPDLIDDLGTGASPKPFFAAIHRSAHRLDENGRPQGSKAEEFLRAVNRLIEESIKNDSDLRRAAARCVVDPDLIKKKDHAENEISTMELSLETYERLINERIHEHKLMIVNRVIGSSCQGLSTSNGQEDHQLNTWLLHRPEPLHPVAVRYVLYQVRNLLETQLQTLVPQNEALDKAIEKYQKRFDIEETDPIETPLDRLAMALEQPFYQRLWKNHFKDFIKDYQTGSAEHLSKLNQYRTEKLRELVLTRLHQLLQQLCANWEQFFFNLEQLETNFRNQASRLQALHAQGNQATVRHVLASPKAKEEIWGKVQSQLGGSRDLPPELRRRIYLDQFALFCRQAFPNQEGLGLGSGNLPVEMEKRAGEVFRDSLLAHLRQDIGRIESLDLDIRAALEQEYQLEHRQEHAEFTDYLRKIQQDLAAQAEPMVNHRPRPDANLQEMTAWGVNEKVFEEQFQEKEKAALFGDGDTTNITRTTFFSRHEIQLLRTTIGLRAEDLATFQPPVDGRAGGSYYQAYQELIDRLEKNPAGEVTPHLDKNWHMPAYLPDLNQEIAKMDEEKKKQAFLLGLVYGWLSTTVKDQENIWQITIPNARRRHITRGGDYVPGTFLALYRSLAFNPAIVDEILAAAAKELEQEQQNVEAEFGDSRFSQGCRRIKPGQVAGNTEHMNIFDAVFQMVNDAPWENLQAETETLLEQAITEIATAALALTGQARQNTARKRARELVDELAEESAIYQAARQDNSNAYQGWRPIIADYRPAVWT